jgi:UrcA family protein
MNPRLLLAPIALLCATITIGSAVSAGAEPFQANAARVSFADLNLASAAGRAALERRIHAAADNVCRVNGRTDLGTLRAADVCFDKTVHEAMARVQTATSETIQYAAVMEGVGDR